jgi:adenylate cyclase
MDTQGFKRKLTAIFSADVEGYSRLMGQDEETTVRTITAYREVMTTLIQQHSGKVVDFPTSRQYCCFQKPEITITYSNL